ncbi:hypothetical protein C8Q79DRAFT_1005850 [Trametes meyenii]|nr:hypothetical protein C8Q79DRAFT_1005850 [Trametes meyenii]
MALFGKGRRLAARQEAAQAQRKYVTRLQRKPYRERRKVISIPKTPAERKVLADIRTEKREKIVDALTSAHETLTDAARQMQEEFGGHNQKYYEQQILQLARLKGSKRKANPWNAYLRCELEKRNKALPAGAPRISSSNKDVVSEIAAQWKSMGTEEKECTVETLMIVLTPWEVRDKLEEFREMKSLSLQTVPISSFHDVCGGMSKMFEEARQQYARTGYNLIIIGCKTSQDQISPPMTFATSQAALDFFPMTLGTSLDDLVSSFEAYSLSGVPGLVGRTIDVIQGLQSHASGLIIQKLGDITEHAAHKMFYVGFADHITDKFGVVIDNWPLPRFSSPSNLRTRIELTTLVNSWETGVTRFRKLTRREWDRWQAQKNDPDGTPEGADFIRAVSLASNLTPAVAQGILPAVDANGTNVIAAQSAPPMASEKTLVLPASKPRKRRSDFGTSRKKHKGAAADAATETSGNTEVPATSRPSGVAPASTPPSVATLEPTPPSVGAAAPATAVPMSTTAGASPSASPAIGAAGTSSVATTHPGATVSTPPLVSTPTAVRASATISTSIIPGATAPMSAACVPQARPSVFDLPAFSFAPEALPSPGPWRYDPAVHPSLGVVPHQWHITPDCMIDPALHDMTPVGLNDSTQASVPTTDTTTFVKYNHESESSRGGRGKRGAGRGRGRGRGGRGCGRGRGESNAPES